MPRSKSGGPAWLAGAATLLALLACYGTLGVVGALSALGVGLDLHEGAWAAAIGLFALLALGALALGYRRHRAVGPLIVGACGTALVLWAMAVSYDRALEVAGFAGLVAGAIWDWQVKRHATAVMTEPS
ncbi:MAG: MerC family mercury resistance protein [Alphaproteobacteria bacterium]|jgi:hypothetical protein|nr:MerC family mercury resistance protein [Alphaproteobacteria bacterium]